MDEKLNKFEIRFIWDVLKLYHKKLQKSYEYIDINNVDNENNLKLCNSILNKKSLLRLESEEWQFISDILENYFEALKVKRNLSDYIDSDDKWDTWFSINDCNNLLIKIDRYI